MAQLLPKIHRVEGVEENIYLLEEGGGQYTLLDTGYPGTAPKILDYLKKINISPQQIRRILLTHVHPDHVGSLKAMVDATKARTFSHWIEAAFIAQDPLYDGPPKHSFKIEPIEVDEKLKDGDTIDVLGGLEVLHTPGHTPGHISLYSKELGILFTGDLFFVEGGKLILTPPQFTHHRLSAIISARRVMERRFDKLLVYHGSPILENGYKIAEELVRSL